MVVIHGEALSSFRSGSFPAGTGERVEALMADGVSFFACANTMQALSISKDQLPGGFSVAENGGVVKIAELQSAGYLYLRP